MSRRYIESFTDKNGGEITVEQEESSYIKGVLEMGSLGAIKDDSGQFVVTLPNGREHRFDTEDEAMEYATEQAG